MKKCLMKYLFNSCVFLLIAIFVFSTKSLHVFAGVLLPPSNPPAFSTNNYRISGNQNWMDEIADETLLSQLSIPGTHNTMARRPAILWIQNQSLTLENQLHNGIRYLDIRVHANNNSFAVHHGSVYVHAMFEDVLYTIKSFLQENPSETVLMRLKQEHTPVQWNEFNDILASYLTDPNYRELFYTNGGNNPSLGSMRGKIVILRDYSSNNNTNIGIPYNSGSIQDDYWVSNLNDKRDAIINQLNFANQSNGNTRVINHLSGTGGHGHHPEAVAKFTNTVAYNHIRSNGHRYVGIVVADFPGGPLINTILQSNQRAGHRSDFRYTFNHSTREATVTDYRGSSTNIVIPSSITLSGIEYKVTHIDSRVFQNKNLTGVELPDSLTSVGNHAFSNNQLTTVSFPDSLTSEIMLL